MNSVIKHRDHQSSYREQISQKTNMTTPTYLYDVKTHGAAVIEHIAEMFAPAYNAVVVLWW